MTRTIRLVVAGAIIAASCSAATAQSMRMSGTKKPDGTLEANRINVGRDGVVPQ